MDSSLNLGWRKPQMNPRVDFGFDAGSQPHFSPSGDLVYQLFAESEIEKLRQFILSTTDGAGVAAISILDKKSPELGSQRSILRQDFWSNSWFKFFHYFSSIKTKHLLCFHEIFQFIFKIIVQEVCTMSNKRTRFPLLYFYGFLDGFICYL